MKHNYQHEVIRHARAIITAAHTEILEDYVGQEVTVSSRGHKSILATRLTCSGGLYSVGRYSFTAEQVLGCTETVVTNDTLLLINI